VGGDWWAWETARHHTHDLSTPTALIPVVVIPAIADVTEAVVILLLIVSITAVIVVTMIKLPLLGPPLPEESLVHIHTHKTVV
jgi:hypothetical protein